MVPGTILRFGIYYQGYVANFPKKVDNMCSRLSKGPLTTLFILEQ